MKNRKVLFVFAITFIIAWLLGIMRFEYVWAKVLYNIFLFPFGTSYYFYETYSRVNLETNNLLNNEYLQLIIWLISVILQALLFNFVLRIISRKHKIYS